MQTETFPTQNSALGNFILGYSQLGYENTQTLSSVLPAYLYEQYNDDPDLLAFVNAYNSLAQGYLDWFNSTPLALYTSSAISGSLLDWSATGIYGVSRPVISSVQSARTLGAMNMTAMNVLAMNRMFRTQTGTAEPASDDIYKRVLAWILYKGDGIQASITWLRKRIARFLYGANGSDVSLSETLNVSITRPTLPAIGAMNTRPMNAAAMNTRTARNQLASNVLEISIPASSAAQQFVSLLGQGYLPVPFQVAYRVTLT